MESSPWTEKYRPVLLDELMLDDSLARRVAFVQPHTFQNLLMYGPPGTGKTTTALSLVKHVLKNSNNYIELNASDNRGINMINELVQGFSKSRGDEGLKIIILDEADNITKRAQERLVNFLENYPWVKFIFTCNDRSQVIEALQSRCVLMKFTKPGPSRALKILETIAGKEGYTQLHRKALLDVLLHSGFDIRKSINHLEAILRIHKKLTLGGVRRFFNKPSLVTIFDLMNKATTEPEVAIKKALEMMQEGMNPLDLVVHIIGLLESIEDYQDYIEFPHDTSIKILEYAHICYHRMTKTTDSKILVIRFLWQVSEILTPCR